MKKILLTSLAAVFAVSAAQAVTPYASLKLGYSSVNIKLTDDMTSATLDHDSIYGWTGAIAGGAQFEVSDMIALRGEVEYAYTKFKGKVKSGNPKDSTYTNQTLLLGGYVDFGGKNWAGFNPYIGLHIGYGFGEYNHYNTSVPDVDADGFAWGASIGTSYAINDQVSLDLSGRYINTIGDVEITGLGTGEFDNDMFSVMLGVRYAF